MRKNKNIIPENYLKKIPKRLESIGWKQDDKGDVTLEIENKGWANRIAQVVFFRPKISYVHLDELGSFVWPLINGERDIVELGKLVDEKFGEKAHPLYERLARYFQILDSYHFIKWVDSNKN